MLPLRGKKPQICVYIQNQYSVVASPSGADAKSNVGAQLQIFPYPTVLKVFLNLNSLMAKLSARTLLIQSDMNKQKANVDLFSAPGTAACKV